MAETRTPHPGMGGKEFVALVAALMATNALGIDTMLPALQQIGSALGVTNGNEKQWIVLSYMLGFGAAQLFYGTLIDRYGRKPILLLGMAGYVICSLVVACATTFEMALIARALQGVAAAVSRVVSVAIVRDSYVGRQMARVMSFAMIVFMGVPVLAPSLGQVILLSSPSWRFIFVALAVFGLAVLVWIAARLPETLDARDKRAIAFGTVTRTFGVIFSNRMWLGYTLASAMIFGSLMGFIVSSQQVFLYVFKAPGLFPVIFATVAGFIAVASLVNARLVERLGMRMLSHSALLAFTGIAGIHAAVAWTGHETLLSFTILQAGMMFCFGLLMGNFGALAMEPVGHMAGSAAAAQGFLSTVLGAVIGYFVGQSFNGTDVPLTCGFVASGCVTLLIVLAAEGGILFRRKAALAH